MVLFALDLIDLCFVCFCFCHRHRAMRARAAACRDTTTAALSWTPSSTSPAPSVAAPVCALRSSRPPPRACFKGLPSIIHGVLPPPVQFPKATCQRTASTPARSMRCWPSLARRRTCRLLRRRAATLPTPHPPASTASTTTTAPAPAPALPATTRSTRRRCWSAFAHPAPPHTLTPPPPPLAGQEKAQKGQQQTQEAS